MIPPCRRAGCLFSKTSVHNDYRRDFTSRRQFYFGFVNFISASCFFLSAVIICSKLRNKKVVIILTHHYGHLLKVLSGCIQTSMNNALASMDLTSAQGHIMGYLSRRSQPPCPRDIEETFHLSHPTVSGLLSRLEKKGFVELRPDDTDRRCKRIYVLPKGKQLNETMYQTILENEARLVVGFSPEEQELFASLLLRAIENMGASVCIRKIKEESDT